jgi:hypothetical protein
MNMTLEKSDVVATNDLNTLELRRQALEDEINTAQTEIQKAKAKQKSTGEYADAIWFAEQKELVRTKTSELHRINREIKALNKQPPRSNTYSILFVQAAKQLLDPETLEKVDSLTNQWIQEK